VALLAPQARRLRSAERADTVPARQLVLILTGRCNAACAYCFEAGRTVLGDLPWEAARRAIDVLLAPRPPKALLAFTGGEPLLAPGLLRRCIRHARRRAAPGTSLAFALTTNGTVLPRDVARFLAEHDVAVRVSFDGSGQELRAPGTRRRVEDGLRRLARAAPGWFRRRVRVTLTLTPENLPLLAESVEAILALDVPEISVVPAAGPRWPPGSDIESELDRQLARIVTLVPGSFSCGQEHPVTLLREPAARELPPDGDFWCSAGSPDGFAVAPDGTAWGCPWWAKPLQRLPGPAEPVAETLFLGDVREAGFEDRLAALPTRAAEVRVLTHRQSKRSPLAECGSCPLLSLCPACPAGTVREPGNTNPDLVPAAVCALTRASARARAALPRSLPSILRELAELSERLSTLAAQRT
jgi:sulfatase maturation enzyme AslB (radical SAM superfamily)